MKDVKFTRQQLTLVVPRANLRDKLHSLLGQVPSINHQNNNFQIKILHGLLGKKLAFCNAAAVTSILQKSLLSFDSNTLIPLCLQYSKLSTAFSLL